MSTGISSGFSGSLSLGDLLHAGAVPDRNRLTKAGRALQKHSNRPSSAFSKPTPETAADYNKAGQDILDDILTHPASHFSTRHTRAFGKVIEIRAADGKGVRYQDDGTFIGFLEPLDQNGGDKQMEIIIASDQEREELFAELYHEEEQWAEIIYDQVQHHFTIQIYAPLSAEKYTFKLTEMQKTLDDAKARLTSLGYHEQNTLHDIPFHQPAFPHLAYLAS
jgi:hypothetical protein